MRMIYGPCERGLRCYSEYHLHNIPDKQTRSDHVRTLKSQYFTTSRAPRRRQNEILSQTMNLKNNVQFIRWSFPVVRLEISAI